MIDITKALAIDGFMSEQELLWLSQRAAEHQHIIEIGSHLGRSTRALGDHTKGTVYALDNWRGPEEAYYSKEEKDKFFTTFVGNVADLVRGGSVIPVICDHAEVELPLFKGIGHVVKPDMVFIDGRHDYSGAKDDILKWKDEVVKGGLLSGHDIDFPGVQEAVLEIFKEIEVVDDTSIWWVIV